MPGEDFTTYTEFDESAKITVDSASKVSWAALETKFKTGYLYKDKGVNHFSGDFTHKFESQFSSMGNFAWANHWMLSNVVGDVKAVIDANDDAAMFFSFDDAEHLYLRLIEAGSIEDTDIWMPPGPQPSTTYYIEIVRDDDGGVNNTGNYTAYIRTGSHSGALQDTLTVDCSVGEQNDFRYIYSFATYDGDFADHGLATGFTQNLDLGESISVNANNIECLSQATAFAFSGLTRSLNAANVECLTQNTEPSIETGMLYLSDVSCETQITAPSIAVEREITIPSIESSTKVGIPIIHKFFELNASDISSLTQITAASIYKELLPSDIECSSEVEAADLEWVKILKLNATLPMITAEMSGGHGGFLNVELPMITAEMRGGAQLNVTLPMITAELEGKVGVRADLNVTLPMITAAMTGTVEVLGQLNVILPMMTARMTGTAGQVGQLNVTLPMITAQLLGYTDIDGQLNVTLPMIEARLVGTNDRFATCDPLRYEEPELE